MDLPSKPFLYNSNLIHRNTTERYKFFHYYFSKKCSSHLFDHHSVVLLNFVKPRPGKFFFYKTRAWSQQIYL